MKRKRIQNVELLRTVSRFPCVACPAPPRESLGWILENLEIAPRISDPHHVTTRGAGGDDVASNLMPLCPLHHHDWHSQGGSFMVSTFSSVRQWLINAERWDLLGEPE